MKKTSKFFNDLKKERNLKNEIIEDQNFQAFIEEFDYSQKKTPKKVYSLKDVENLLIEKAHNLKIYHETSSAKNERKIQNIQKSEQYYNDNSKIKFQNKENREPIFIEEMENDFFLNSSHKKHEFMQKSEKKEPEFIKNSDQKSSQRENERDRIWKRLQDDRKAEKMQREMIKRQKEEQEVLKK